MEIDYARISWKIVVSQIFSKNSILDCFKLNLRF